MRSFKILMMAACVLLSMLASKPVLADANTAKAKQLYEGVRAQGKEWVAGQGYRSHPSGRKSRS